MNIFEQILKAFGYMIGTIVLFVSLVAFSTLCVVIGVVIAQTILRLFS